MDQRMISSGAKFLQGNGKPAGFQASGGRFCRLFHLRFLLASRNVST
jgi:hypothetical protein